MAAEMRNIQGAYDASMGLFKVVQAAGKMEARAREEAVRGNAMMIKEASARVCSTNGFHRGAGAESDGNCGTL